MSTGITLDISDNTIIHAEYSELINDGIKTVIIPDNVTSIGNNVFSSLYDNLTNVNFGNSSVTSIGSNAFKNCIGLNDILLHVPLQNIGSYAFMGCNNLSFIKIPESLTNIEECAFQGCSNLENINFLNTKISSIPNKLFQGCSKLESLVLPSTITSISTNAFDDCINLTSIIIPNSVVIDNVPIDILSEIKNEILYNNNDSAKINFNNIQII